jgi:TonB family protein
VTGTLFYSNLGMYSLQIGLLVALAAFVPALVGLGSPRARLLYWQILLAACLLLPLMRPWRHDVFAEDSEVSVVMTRVVPGGPHHRSIPWDALPPAVLAAGILGRLAWLGVGFYRLRRYRRQATPLHRGAICPALVTQEISSPVTFGFFRPVILLPARFPSLPPTMQEAILRHESLHVERRDWLFTVGEELVRAVFWFHPAIWWLLSEIQLAREQVVDRCVVAATGERDPYVDTLLTVASAGKYLDVASAPLFLRRRHLKQRVIGILKERDMSKKALISALAAGLMLMAGACWLVTGALPLAAAPQVMADSSGVSVNLNGAALLHRAPVNYPAGAKANRVEGVVAVQVKLDASGEVADAIVLSGPEELRKTVMQSVFNWHFSKDLGGSTRTVTVDFVLPKLPAPVSAPSPTSTTATVAGESGTPSAAAQRTASTLKRLEGQLPSAQAGTPEPPAARRLSRIDVGGLSDEARASLLEKLPVRVGDSFDARKMFEIRVAANNFDPHLAVTTMSAGGNDVALRISLPNTGAQTAAGDAPRRIRVGGNVQANNLIEQTRPIYPPLAKQARISGTVELAAIIGADGHIVDLQVLQGHPLLAQAALDAVKNWVYKPTLLNGDPIEVATIIDVNFTLAQ